MATFVEIVDRGSLTAAAEALERSLPAVVRTLAALEAALGARLLTRTTRRIAITEEGRHYLAHCRRILAEVDEAEQALGEAQREPAGALRVTAPVLFGQMHVAPLVGRFLERYRRVQVELVLLDRVVDIVDEGFDAALRIAHLPDSSMVAIPVGSLRRVVCASPALLAAGGAPDHPRELAERDCVLFSGMSAGGGWRFSAAGRGFAVPVSGPFSCNHATAAVAACADGLGFGMFLSYQVEPEVAAGRLAVVLEAFEPAPIPVSVVYPQARLLSARVRVLVDWLVEGLRERRWGQL